MLARTELESSDLWGGNLRKLCLAQVFSLRPGGDFQLHDVCPGLTSGLDSLLLSLETPQSPRGLNIAWHSAAAQFYMCAGKTGAKLSMSTHRVAALQN